MTHCMTQQHHKLRTSATIKLGYMSFLANLNYLGAESRPCSKSHFKLLKQVSNLRSAFNNSQRSADFNAQLHNAAGKPYRKHSEYSATPERRQRNVPGMQ